MRQHSLKLLASDIRDERDELIMRLRDEQGLTCKQIGIQVRLSPKSIFGIIRKMRKSKE